jgi:hypothetical protein
VVIVVAACVIMDGLHFSELVMISVEGLHEEVGRRGVGQVDLMLRIKTDVEVIVRTDADGHDEPVIIIEYLVTVEVAAAAADFVTVFSGGQLRLLVFGGHFVVKGFFSA